MIDTEVTRRRLLKGAGATVAGLSVLRIAGPSAAFQTPVAGEVIPWLDQPAENPVPEIAVQQLVWEDLDSWITPTERFFVIKHYNEPALTEADYRLTVDGLVTSPMTLSLADLKARDRQEVTCTLECSGNSGLPFLTGAVGNATWAGTSLSAILTEAGVQDEGMEVVFWGADAGEQTWREEITITEHFARSMSLTDAMAEENILAYEMNGAPLPSLHGFPVRLIAPGWYGIANVKWLTRIELRDSRFQGHFMARDYVTIREEEHDGEKVWTFSSVTHDRIKSAPAKVTRQGDSYTILGAAWGAPIAGVEVRIDDGPWQSATITEGGDTANSWVFWTLDWVTPTSGEHTITSRATDSDGNVQPAPDDSLLVGKATFWESNGHITRVIEI